MLRANTLLLYCLVLLFPLPLIGQEKLSPETAAKIQSLKKEVCAHLEELLRIKDKSSFREFGFGVGGPHNKWIQKAEALRDAQPKGISSSIPLELRASPGDLMVLGLEYAQNKKVTDYIRTMLPEIKLTIGFEEYRFNKARDEAIKKLKTKTKWNDATGKYKTEADFVRIDDDVIVLKKTDGKVVKVPVNKLGKSELSLVKAATAKLPKPVKGEVVSQELKDEVIGKWYEKFGDLKFEVEIARDSGKLYYKQYSPDDGSRASHEIKETKAPNGRKFSKLKSFSGTGDHWILDTNGDLHAWDRQGKIKTLEKR